MSQEKEITIAHAENKANIYETVPFVMRNPQLVRAAHASERRRQNER